MAARKSVFTPATVTTLPATSVLSATTTAVAAGTYPISVSGTGSNGVAPQRTAVTLKVIVGKLPDIMLSEPADASNGVVVSPTFRWIAAANAATYTLAVASDATFATIVRTVADRTGNSIAVSGLAPHTTYYWRVGAFNSCGSTTSAFYSFTTANQICSTAAVVMSDDTTTTRTLTIADPAMLTGLKLQLRGTHTYVSDLRFTLSKESASATVIDWPGIPATSNGCDRDNIDVALDDAAATWSRISATRRPRRSAARKNRPML